MKNRFCQFSRIPTLVCLALVLAVGFSCAFGWSYSPRLAFAETDNVSIVSKDNASATYNAYQVFAADVDEDNTATHIAWGNDVDSGAVIEFLNQYGYQNWITDNNKGPADNAQNAAEFIGISIGAATGVEDPLWVDSDTFAYEFANWLVSESALVPTTLESVDGQAQLSADEGYYLITSADVTSESLSATLPIWLPLGGSAHEVVVKAGTPSIEKHIVEDEALVDWCDNAIGSEVTYQVATTLPSHYHGFATYFYQVNDNIPLGMSVDLAGVIVEHGDQNITDQFDITVDENNRLSVTAQDLKALEEQFESGDVITISYTVALSNLDEIVFGGTGNVNGAELVYSNDPYSDTKATIESNTTTVYSYQISLDKTDSETGAPVAGAKFVIKQENGGFLVQTDDSFAWSGDFDNATQFETDNNGVIEQMPGLDAGHYILTEVQMPEGYSDPGESNSFSLDIEPSYSDEGELEGITAHVSNNATLNPSIAENGIDVSQGMVNIDVTNEKTPVGGMFDKTGDIGSWIFPLAITASLCIAVGILLWRKKLLSKEGNN